MSVTTTETTRRSSYARIPSAFRLQFTVPSTLVWVPLLIFVAVWLMVAGVGIWVQAIADERVAAEEPVYTGASQAALWCLVFMAAYTASHTFPFSMALSYSRRVFVIGAFLAFGLVSLGYGAAFALAGWVERVTDGFGVHFYTFDLPFLTAGQGGLLGAGTLAAVLCLFLMMFGFFWSILYRRVTVRMLWTVVLSLVAVLLVLVMLITQNAGWAGIWEWFTAQTAWSLAAWCVLPAVAVTVINYLVIRKATPTP